MSAFIKIDAIVLVGAVVGLVAFAAAGKALQESGLVRQTPAVVTAARALAIVLFAVIGVTAIPLMVHVVIAAQVSFGNGDLGIVRLARESEFKIIIAFWSLIGLGAAVALPAAYVQLSRRPAGAPPSEGVLRVGVGMPIDQVGARSTLNIGAPRRVEGDGSMLVGGEGVFDLEIDGPGVPLGGCRAYWVRSAPGSQSVDHVSINMSPPTLSDRDAADLAQRVRERLRAGGWQQGRNRRTTYRPRGAGAAAALSDGEYWAKDGTLLILTARPMENAAAPDHPPTFMLFLELVPRQSPLASSAAFDPPGG